VATLMAMPAARGLFHRAIIESAAGIRAREREDSARRAESILAALGLGRGPDDAAGLQDLPLASLYAAATALDPMGGLPAGVDGGWGATIDGQFRHPFDPDAPDASGRRSPHRRHDPH
ncbi:MAG: hypothetical protein ACRDNS_15360, partial [Trebonia sp.]